MYCNGQETGNGDSRSERKGSVRENRTSMLVLAGREQVGRPGLERRARRRGLASP